MMLSSKPRNIAFALAFCALVAVPSTALGQAWVGVKGNLNVAMDYTYSGSDQIVESEGQVFPPPGAGSTNHTLAIGAEYVPIDKLAVNLSIPIVTTKYHTDPAALFPGHGSYDDGNLHTVLQDIKLVTRYMVLDNQPVALSPHIGFSLPASNYETTGYAAAGRGLKQLHLGLSVGKFFTEGPIANTYMHLNYEFSLVEKYKTVFPETGAYGQNRSDIHGLIGRFIGDKFEANIGFDYRKNHGGLNFLDYGAVPAWVQFHHDALLAESLFLIGAGGTYEPIEGLRFNLGIRFFMTGTNTRAPEKKIKPFIVTIGLSWDAI